MSTADGQEFSDALNGDYYELYSVYEDTDDAGETITVRDVIGYTLAGITLSNDAEDWTVNPSSEGVLQNFSGKGDLSLEFTGYIAAGGDALDDLGFLTEDGTIRTAVRHPMIEVWVYNEPPNTGGTDLEPQEIVELPAFIARYDDLDFQEGDAGEVNFASFVNGLPRLPLRVGETVPSV